MTSESHPLIHAGAAVPVAIYARVSTQGQVGGRFDSCESQAAICRDYLAKHANEGWVEAFAFTDAAYSGGTMDRPGIRALKTLIEAGEVKVVLIFKLERVLRSTDEWGPFRSFLQRHGCRLVSATEDLSEDTPSGRLKNNLLVSVAEYERLNTAEKVRAKMLEQAKRGYWNYGRVPYGYDYDPRKQELFPHPVEADVVRRVFEQAAKGVRLSEIANQLNAEGIRTRARLDRLRDGQEKQVGHVPFRIDSLQWMLRNPIYAGKVRFMKREYPGRHQALVTAEMWERANCAITVQPLVGVGTRMLKEEDKYGTLLKGVLHCGHCRRAMFPTSASPAKGHYRYYSCGRDCRHPGSSSAKGVWHVPAEAVELAVVRYLGELAQADEMVRQVVGCAEEFTQADSGAVKRRLVEMRKAVEEATGQIRRCTDLLVMGETATLSEELRERVTELKTRRAQLVAEQQRMEEQLEMAVRVKLTPERTRQALRELGRLLPSRPPEERKRLMQLCFERVSVRDGGRRIDGTRRLELDCRVKLVSLVTAMESKLVIESGLRRPAAESALTTTICVETTFGRTIRLVSPFEAVLKAPAVGPRKVNFRKAFHPIHRALEWKRIMELEPTLTGRELAERENVREETVCHYLRLLKLAPSIQEALRSMVVADEVRKFGLVRMKDLSKKPMPEQRRIFARWREGFRNRV